MKFLRLHGNHDIVVVQKKRLGRFVLRAIRRRCGRLLYDLDDAVMFNSSRHASPDSPRRMAAFRRMAEAVDGIIAGSQYLAKLAEPYTKRVWVVPTSIDLARYRAKEDYTLLQKRAVLGWIGGRKSLSLLEPLLPVLERLGAKFPGLSLKVISAPVGELQGPAQEKEQTQRAASPTYSLKQRCQQISHVEKVEESNTEPNFSGDMRTIWPTRMLKVVFKAWSEAEEARDVASFDVGLAPLPDHPWAAGKCSTKLLQCMAAGVPCVAAPVGSQKEIITDGTNGFLAASEQEWLEKLSLLLTDAGLRERLGRAGRKRVEDAYSLAVSAPRLLEVLQGNLSGPCFHE